MTVTRYLNGKEISREDLYKIKISNPVIQEVYSSVVRRVRKSEKLSRLNDESETKIVEI